MKSIKFPEVNNHIAENQEEYETVYANVSEDGAGLKTITVCFEFTDEEIQEMVKTKKLWYQQQTGHYMAPMNITAIKPI